MVLTFTGQRVPKMPSLVQDKNWFFNGIDIYRTMSSINVFAVQDKIGSSMVLIFTGMMFP